MIQILIFLVIIGLTLFLWKTFPAFKWVFAVVVVLPTLYAVVDIYNYDHPTTQSYVKPNAEVSKPFIQAWEEKQELVIPSPHKLTPEEWEEKATRQKALDEYYGRVDK
jgi:hypothetical protein